ncbi:MAG: hypothetical protein Q7N50_08205 [Armatimonadota bacterium]|nr:hypothetical protein [Armatimonadota bacterium]
MKRMVWLFLLLALAIMPAQAQIPEIQGFDPRCISIDGNVTPADDSSCIDWRLKDLEAPRTLVGILDGVGNADPSILSPGSILSAGSMLPKQDITRVWLSNNRTYFFLAEERRSNNGSSAYHLFVTKNEPTAILGQPVVFYLENGDLEIRICFPRGSAPEDASITIQQVRDLTETYPVQVTDIWSSGVFQPSSILVEFAINTSPTDAIDGAKDSKGVLTGTYDTACFAEAAVPLELVGIPPCGAQAYMTVVTRSSCSLTSDVKDIGGPVRYGFGGSALVVATPTVDCTTTVGFSATASGGTTPYTFNWYDNESSTPFHTATISSPPFTDAFTQSLTAGTHDIRVTVTDVSECTEEYLIPQFTVYNELGLTLDVPTPNCENTSTLSATASGGTGSYRYEWFDGATPIHTNDTSGTDSFDYTFQNPSVNPTDHTIKVVVTDLGRTDVVCAKDDTKTVTVYQLLDGTLTAGTATCGAFTWTATPSGGKASYTYEWKLDGVTVPGETGATYNYGPDADCTDHEVCVTITDDRNCTKTLCKKVHQEVTTTFPTP